MSEAADQVYGNYRIGTQLGIGGMGRVFSGVHIHLNRPVAIKIMHEHLLSQQDFRERFLQEARAVALLDHPNIVRVYDFGEENGQFYLVMELVVGGTIRTLLDQASNSPDGGIAWRWGGGLEYIRQAADGLAHAHQRGMVHRDIKPDNLLVSRSSGEAGEERLRIKIADFGLAKLAEGSMITATGTMMGTPSYMSPEQCQGIELDGRSDIYSLGVILYEMVTGQLPFESRTPTEAIFKHISTPPSPPQDIYPELPDELNAIILRCLAKKPAERFDTAHDLAQALANFQQKDTVVDLGPTPSIHALVGKQIDKYVIESALTSGAIAHTYRGRQIRLERPVVLKILRSQLAQNSRVVERFLDEARQAARLRHPGIVEIYDIGSLQDLHYIAMAYVPGQTLRWLIEEEPLELAEVVTCIQQLAAALDYAHQHGVIHRAVKPGNIIIQPDHTAVLLDFGLAAALEETTENEVAVAAREGTPSYLAPEQTIGGEVTASSDIYALGCLAYELLTGRVPFTDSDVELVFARHRGESPIAVHDLNPNLSPELSRVINRAMAKNPADRYETAGAFAADLTNASRFTPAGVNAPPIDPPPAPPATGTASGGSSWGWTEWLRPIALLAVIIILAGIYFIFFRDRNDSKQDPQQSGLVAATDTAEERTTASPADDSTRDATSTAATQYARPTPTATVEPAYVTEPSATLEPTATPLPTETPVPPPPTEQLVFVSGRSGDPNISDIFFLNPDGTNTRLFSSFIGSSYTAWSPAWSPDGQEIAFVSNSAGNDDIYVINVDGTDLRQLTTDPAADQYPAWSPDGSQLAFQSKRQGDWEIFLMDADGSNQQNLTMAPGSVDWGPDWHPDGGSLIFVSTRDGSNDIFSLDLDSLEVVNLTNTPETEENPVWSPDGQTIAFGRFVGENSEIFVLQVDSGETLPLTDSIGQDTNPAWSYDGSKIAFSSDRDGNLEIYVMNADGSDQTRLTSNPGYDGDPSWSPLLEPTE